VTVDERRLPGEAAGGDPVLVSVVIPSHNYAHYVGQAIQSALEQGYRRVEVIVVDDGSTDGTATVLRGFEGRIRVVHLDGRGVSAARNAGLAQAAGKYVVFLDADDLLVRGGTSAQVALLTRRPDVDAVAGAWYACDVELGEATLGRGSLGEGDALSQLILSNIVATPSTMMLRREALEAAGGFDTTLSFAADWEMWLRLARRGCRFAHVRAPVAMYRIHGRSMTRTLDGAIKDVTGLLDRTFRDPALPDAMRLAESRARFGASAFLAGLCLEQGDTGRGGNCLREALHWNPEAGDTLGFYREIAGAISRHGRINGLDVVSTTAALLSLTSELDGGRDGCSSRRKALRLLAAGIVARSAGAWSLGLWHLGAAVRQSWRTVILPAQLRSVALLLLPRWLTRSAGALLARVGMRGEDLRPPPAIVRAALARDAGRRS
jgi:hypothetical protein